MTEKPLVFMVEDEESVLSVNKRMLARRGYQVEQATCAADAYTWLDSHTPDLLILDIMLPDGDGYEICRRFREKSENPVCFLTGKNAIQDKVEGLSLGCDYYLTKPYQFAELLAVVQRLLERSRKQQTAAENILHKGSLVVDLHQSKALLDGQDTQLTSKEFGLLLLLMENENKELSTETLYERVWNTAAGHDTRTVRKHIMNLRSKIHAGETDDYDIETVYGKGYVFRCGE